MKIALVSSVYGSYDIPVAPAPQSTACEYVMVTDQDYGVEPWRYVVEARPQLHPRLAAKVAKCRPDLYADADVYIWVDASIQITSREFVGRCVEQLGGNVLAQITHPDRTRIYDEAEVSAGMAKYHGLPVREQAAHYISRGYPDGWGLWATGIIAYRRGRELAALGDAWLREQLRWSYQDQISQPPLLHDLGLRPSVLDGPLFPNPHFAIRGHRSEL